MLIRTLLTCVTGWSLDPSTRLGPGQRGRLGWKEEGESPEHIISEALQVTLELSREPNGSKWKDGVKGPWWWKEPWGLSKSLSVKAGHSSGCTLLPVGLHLLAALACWPSLPQVQRCPCWCNRGGPRSLLSTLFA